jgi:hypothetical protein
LVVEIGPKSEKHLTVAMLLYSSSGRVPFVEGILDAKIFAAAAPVCDLTTTSPHVPIVDSVQTQHDHHLTSNPGE